MHYAGFGADSEKCLALLYCLRFLGDTQKLAQRQIEHSVLQLQRIIAHHGGVDDYCGNLPASCLTHTGDAVVYFPDALPSILERIAFYGVDDYKAHLGVGKIEHGIILPFVHFKTSCAEKRMDDGDRLEKSVLLFCRVPLLSGDIPFPDEKLLDDPVSVIKQMIGIKTEEFACASHKRILPRRPFLKRILGILTLDGSDVEGKGSAVMPIQSGKRLHIIQCIPVTPRHQ